MNGIVGQPPLVSFLSMTACLAGCVAMLHSQAVLAQTPDLPLTVAVAHVPDAPLPGARVRTPPGIELPLAKDLARLAGVPLQLQAIESSELQTAPRQPGIDLAFARAAPGSETPAGITWHALGYTTHPMAIMRTDTDIRRWQHLQGRTVCVVRSAMHVGEMTEQYGAIEQVHDTPTEALIGLRVGTCDALVHDDRLLDALLAFPEWQKFSAQLRDETPTELVLVSARDDSDRTRLSHKTTQTWLRGNHLQMLEAKRAREIAFEVYLEQDVPDCH